MWRNLCLVIAVVIGLLAIACLPVEDQASEQAQVTNRTANPAPRQSSQSTAPDQSDESKIEQDDLDSEHRGELVKEESTPGEESQETARDASGAGSVEPVMYVVQHEDTLNKISRTFNVSVDLFIQANNIDAPNVIRVGQELRIPVGGTNTPCLSPEMEGYLRPALYSTDAAYAAADVLVHELEGATSSRLSDEEWSGLLVTAELDLGAAGGELAALMAPSSAEQADAKVKDLADLVLDAELAVEEFTFRRVNSPDAALPKLREAMKMAEHVRTMLLVHCDGWADPSTEERGCPTTEEAVYFAALSDHLEAIDEGMTSLGELAEGIRENQGIPSDPAWWTKLSDTRKTLRDTESVVIELEQPIGVRYDIALHVVYLAEDAAFAAALFELAVEVDDADTMIDVLELLVVSSLRAELIG